MPNEPTPARSPFADIRPALGDYTDKVLFGDLWKRPGLSTHLAFYSGWPTASSAVAIASKVFEEATR